MSSEDPKSGGSLRSSKPTTRSSSLRQSLNLASVGKALIAGVRNKDSSDEAKASKKSRRHSAIVSPVAAQPINAPRASVGGESRPPVSTTKRENISEAKNITRRRVSVNPTRTPTEEQSMKPSDNMTQSARATRLRAANASGLPKPRPKSAVVDTAKPATPVRTGTRRRLSTSSEDNGKEQEKPQVTSPKERESRPISPLPHRAALKTSSAVNSTPPVTPSTPTSKLKPPTPSGNRGSPTRPAKVMKTAAVPAVTSTARPPSSASSVSSSFTPRTPKGSALKAVLTRSAKDRASTGNPPRDNSPISSSRDSPSPLARRSRPTSKLASSSSSHAGNMSHISEANSEDSEEEEDVNVMLLLPPTTNLGAPTPAIPRIQRTRRHQALETPSRDQPSLNKEKSRPAPRSTLTPTPSRPPTLRVPKSNITPNTRQSILSWEQISNDASRTLGEGEAERMIADIPAPFSGPTSPALSSLLDIPPSPCLSAIDSPGGFGSISQVLLPDVTPSPAVFANASARFSISPEAAGESSQTYLRLQLASVENLASERLMRIQAMEEEIHNLKQAHMQQIDEMAKQMAYMEREDERSGYTASLEEQLRITRASNQQAIDNAVFQAEAAARTKQDNVLKAQRYQFDLSCAAVLAETSWVSVVEACNIERESIRGEREMLALLLADLENISVS